jgi:peptide/nickel transport system substrate-binding protein
VIPQVVDIRLDRPMPGFLAVLARPELALRRAREDGTGPYRIIARKPTAVALEPRMPHALPIATLHGLRAALAVVRFRHELTDLVTGGTIGSLPLVRAADLAGPTLRFDPVHGLYGLAVIGDGGPLADPALRRALLMGLDDEALVARADLPGLSEAGGLVAADAGDYAPPAKPDWLNQPIAQRRPLAIAAIRAWTADHGQAPEVTIARPEAAGDRLMINLLAAQWQGLGVTVTFAAPGRPADLELIDEIAPIASAEWYLGHFTCKATIACSPVADASLAAATQGKLHAALTGEAARLMADQVPFFPLANPLRWSLVAPGLDGYRDNPLALHPIATLRARPAS